MRTDSDGDPGERARDCLKRARAFVASANEKADRSGVDFFTPQDRVELAKANALLAIAEMTVPPEPGIRLASRPK